MELNGLLNIKLNLQNFVIGMWQLVCLVHETAVRFWEQKWTEANNKSQNNVENFVTSFEKVFL